MLNKIYKCLWVLVILFGVFSYYYINADAIETKQIRAPYSSTGVTAYAMIRQSSTGYYFDSTTGTFVVSPTNATMALIENGTEKGRYEMFENREIWADGYYEASIYERIGVTNDPASDLMFSSWDAFIRGDKQYEGGVVYTASGHTIANSSSTDIAQQTTLLAMNTTILAINAVTTTGSGDTWVSQDYGGVDNLRVLDSSGNPVDNVDVYAFLKTDYDAGNYSTAFLKGKTRTDVEGRWSPGLLLDSGITYTLIFSKQGIYGPATQEVTP